MQIKGILGMELQNDHQYDDIIMLEYHGSKRHSRMSLLNRAAQFAPFAALNGYDAAIQEAARQGVVSGEVSDGIK